MPSADSYQALRLAPMALPQAIAATRAHPFAKSRKRHRGDLHRQVQLVLVGNG